MASRSLQRLEELPFKVKVIGHCRVDVPDSTVRLRNWDMQPIRTAADLALLAPRARQRLLTLTQMGLTPAELVIYHERTKGIEVPDVRPTVHKVAVWASQELPVYADNTAKFIAEVAPPLIKFTGIAVMALVMAIAYMLMAAVSLLGAIDPVLVWIDEEGTYWEIDRWWC